MVYLVFFSDIFIEMFLFLRLKFKISLYFNLLFYLILCNVVVFDGNILIVFFKSFNIEFCGYCFVNVNDIL